MTKKKKKAWRKEQTTDDIQPCVMIEKQKDERKTKSRM